MKILEILILVIPVTVWALWNDRNGDKHETSDDVVWETILMIFCISVILWIEYTNKDTFLMWKCVCVSITGFGLIFPYAFNYMWWSKYHDARRFTVRIFKTRCNYVLTRLSETAIPDKYFLKYNIHYLVRLALYVALFGISVYWFI